MMKTYAISCADKKATGQKRLDARTAHFAHIENVLDDILVAGPLKDNAGNITGSLLIIKAPSEHDAMTWLKADPYHAADIWKEIIITEFTAAAGEWIGGKIW